MALELRYGSCVVVLALLGCSGAQGGNTAQGAGTASASASQEPTGGVVVAPVGVGTGAGPAASSAVVVAPAASSTEPQRAVVPPVHSVSSATDAPGPTMTSTAVPGAAPTPDELDVIAMCTGKKSMFTDKEAKLLKLAESSGDPALQEHAQTIRTRRQEALKEACDRLKAAGKL